MQVQLDLYNSGKHPGNDADTIQTIKMVTEQNERLSKMVKTLLDMSELQTVGRDETIIVNALVDVNVKCADYINILCILSDTTNLIPLIPHQCRKYTALRFFFWHISHQAAL